MHTLALKVSQRLTSVVFKASFTNQLLDTAALQEREQSAVSPLTDYTKNKFNG
jgi:hypothetical protein